MPLTRRHTYRHLGDALCVTTLCVKQIVDGPAGSIEAALFYERTDKHVLTRYPYASIDIHAFRDPGNDCEAYRADKCDLLPGPRCYHCMGVPDVDVKVLAQRMHDGEELFEELEAIYRRHLNA